MSDTNLSISQIATWKIDGQVWAGNIVSFDDNFVALCNVERVVEGGNVPLKRPILFVARGDITTAPHPLLQEIE